MLFQFNTQSKNLNRFIENHTKLLLYKTINSNHNSDNNNDNNSEPASGFPSQNMVFCVKKNNKNIKFLER
jgi:hypothetical protein